MEPDNQNEKKPHPEKTGKMPASGVISETYKEEANPQDILESSSSDPQDPEKSEEEDASDEDADNERYQNGELDNEDEEATPSKKNDDEFLK